MKQTQTQILFERYKMMSDEQLQEIIDDDSYEESAKRIAREILESDRTEYRTVNEEKAQQRQREASKQLARQTDPLYDDIHQIACDLRFIKNCIIC